MTPELGKKYLITTDNWFHAPDGDSYRAVFGTITDICSDKDSLGIKTNRHSTDWYVIIGNMMVAGCQVHYCIQTDNVNPGAPSRDIAHNGELFRSKEANSRIYNADETY